MADPWVAPDTPAPSAPPPAPPSRPPVASRATGAGDIAVPVALRPMTIPDVLDGGLRAFKLAPATMAGVAAAFVVPTQVLVGVLSRDTADDVGRSLTDALTATGPDDFGLGVGGDLLLLAIVLQGVALACVTAAVSVLVTGWYTGRPRPSPTDLITGALRRSWALVAAWTLVHLVELVFAVALFVPVIVPMAWFAVVSPVVACEAAGPLRAMRRSYRLTKRRFGAVLAACLLAALTHEVLDGALSALGLVYLELDLPAGWVVNTAVAAGTQLVTTPFVAAVATLVYLDLRVRTEGLDIELAAARRFP